MNLSRRDGTDIEYLHIVTHSGEARSRALVWLTNEQASTYRAIAGSVWGLEDDDNWIDVVARYTEAYSGSTGVRLATIEDIREIEDPDGYEQWSTPDGVIVVDIESVILGRPQGVTPTERAKSAFFSCGGTAEEQIEAALDEYDLAMDEWRRQYPNEEV